MNKLLPAITAPVGLVLALSAQAASINPSLDDVLQLRVGPFFTDINSSVRVGGADFDLEDRLDDNKTTAAVFGRWRITPRFHLNFGYSAVDRDETETLTAGIPVGGTTVPAGTSFTAQFKTSSASAGLAYAFVKNNTTEFGLDLGVSLTKVEDTLRTTPPGGPTVVLLEQDTTEPLPSVGAFLNYAFSPQWMLAGSFRWLGLDIGDLDLTIYDAFGGIEFRPWTNVGFGAAYLYQKADGTVTDGNTVTNVEWKYKGPFAYLMFGF